MNRYRQSLIQGGYKIKLTTKESQFLKPTSRIFYKNPSWLMKNRGNLKYTHSEYPGPFTKENVRHYHLYCSLEMWEALAKDPQNHWDYRGNDGYCSYNPPDKVIPSRCCMCLPITQRQRNWKWRLYIPDLEMFDDLEPFYY